ncbi:hypothetical protein [Paenibacillus beijingensis]|nr:hypothetical protein [Paenibacillus beijingensis]
MGLIHGLLAAALLVSTGCSAGHIQRAEPQAGQQQDNGGLKLG